MRPGVTAIHQASERGDVTSKDWRAGRGRDGRVWIFVALATAVLAVAAIALLLRGIGPASQTAAITHTPPYFAIPIALIAVRFSRRRLRRGGSVGPGSHDHTDGAYG